MSESNIFVDAASFIKSWEGLKLKSYLCPAGIWTIGYGTTAGITPGMQITKEEAEKLLIRDVKKYYKSLIKLTKVPLNDNQTIALLDFMYNLGSGAYQASTLRMNLNRGHYDLAANEFLKWNKARVNNVLMELKGLTKRRIAEKELFKL